MVNVLYVIALTSVLSCVLCVPVTSTENGTSTEPNMDHRNFEVVYDQRQNGTENFKVNLSRVVLFLAPSQPLIPSLPLLDSQQLISPFRNAEKETNHQKNGRNPAKNAAKARIQSRTNKRKYTLPMLLKAFIPIEIRRNSNDAE